MFFLLFCQAVAAETATHAAFHHAVMNAGQNFVLNRIGENLARETLASTPIKRVALKI